MENSNYEEVKQRYIELFKIKRFKKSNSIEMMIAKIKEKEAKDKAKILEDEYNDKVRNIYIKIFGSSLYYYKFDYFFTKSILARYFKPKQIDLFYYTYVKNPYYSSGPEMRIYSLSDIVKVCYEEKIKPREVFKDIGEWDGDGKELANKKTKINNTDLLFTEFKEKVDF